MEYQLEVLANRVAALEKMVDKLVEWTHYEERSSIKNDPNIGGVAPVDLVPHDSLMQNPLIPLPTPEVKLGRGQGSGFQTQGTLEAECSGDIHIAPLVDVDDEVEIGEMEIVKAEIRHDLEEDPLDLGNGGSPKMQNETSLHFRHQPPRKKILRSGKFLSTKRHSLRKTRRGNKPNDGMTTAHVQVGEEGGTIICSCGKTYQHLRNFRRHVSGINLEVACELRSCKETFKSKTTMVHHFKTRHLRERPYSCGCGKSFTSRAGRSKHEKTKGHGGGRTGVGVVITPD